MGLLTNNGYAYAPTWLKTKSGKLWTRVNGTVFYATEWVEGHTLGQNVGDMFELGVALARLHHLSRQFAKVPCPRGWLTNLKVQDTLFRRQLPHLQAKKTSQGKWFEKQGDTCRILANEAWGILGQPHVAATFRHEMNRSAWIHGDITRFNVIISGAMVKLIDWDRLRPGFPLMELVKAISNTADFSPSEIEAILQGYASVRPFFGEQRQIIRALFRLPGEAWVVGNQVAHGKTAGGFQVLAHTWSSRLQAIRWLDEWAQQGPPL
jgi:Ser/Thr protein kinase RdoA (MazF antagonist)